MAIGSLLRDRAWSSQAYTHQPCADEMLQTAQAIEAAGARCFAAPLDVRSDAAVEGFHDDAVAALGSIDILVNAAGVSCQVAIAEMTDETWATVIDTNLNGAFRTIKRCLPGMIERRWGRIVNLGSTAARVGFARYAAYCASKHAVLRLTRCVALEGAPHGVTCNAINPGFVDTGLTRRGSVERVRQGGQGASVADNLARIAASQPQRRLIPAEEIAALAVFLCRDEAFGLTMEDVQVSGGTLW